MLRKVNNSIAMHMPDMDHLLALAYRTINPVQKEEGQCRFMMFIRLRPGIPSHFRDQSRTGYYPGDKYTDKEPEMLRNLIKMLDKRLSQYDRVELYDNAKHGAERIILKITNDCIDKNDLHLYSLMLSKFILPKWITVSQSN